MAPAWRLLLAAVAARPVGAAHEKYVIQGFAPEHAGAIDAKPPDGFSTIELTAGTNASTKVTYSVARTGRRKGVAHAIDARLYRTQVSSSNCTRTGTATARSCR